MGENGGTDFGDFVCFSCIFIIFHGIFGALIIPKWLIKVPRHIPIFFGSFLELRKCSPDLDLATPFCNKITSGIQGNSPIIFKHITFTYPNILKIQNPQRMEAIEHHNF